MSNGPFLESIVLGGEKLTIRDPNADHDITIESILNKIYPVGSVLLRYDNLDPNSYLGVGKWSLFETGKYFKTTATTPGETGGSNEVTIAVENLPQHNHNLSESGTHTHDTSIQNSGEHNHTVTVSNSGSHNHSGSIDNSGEHTHNLKGHDGLGASGSSGIKLGATGADESTAICKSAGEHTHDITIANAGTHTHTATLSDSGEHTHTINVDQSGSHTHEVGYTGNNAPLTITPEYITVKAWRRVS